MADAVEVTVGPDDSDDELRRKAALVRPSSRQLAWQRQELTAFVHFGINTFTGREWGTGSEDPALFDPVDLDCDQWARTLSAAGFRTAILTAKHHDGFALWPSRFTKHAVTNRDVVREFADAARARGLGVGFYLSPADLHERSYGNGRPATETHIGGRRYDLDDYNRFYLHQLHELLTDYGPVGEVWFDGADATGTEQPYAYDAWIDLVHAVAPDAVCAIGGPDVRWVGNEEGYARPTEWSVIPFTGVTPTVPVEHEDLAGFDAMRSATHLKWYPAEVDVSIRPGWFHHPEEDGSVKSVAELLALYRTSVGRNAVLLLNVPPDRRGLIGSPDAERLTEFGRAVRDIYDTDLATNLPDPVTFNVIGLREDITKGQLVESFAVDIRVDGDWIEVATATTIGHCRLLPLPTPVTTDAVRTRLLSTRGTPSVTLTLHLDPSIPAPPTAAPSDSTCLR